MGKKPQVLLLGNGLNNFNGERSWKGFLQSISDENSKQWIDEAKGPMTFQAILISGNNLSRKLKEKSDSLLPKQPLEDKCGFWEMLLNIEFDDIITTNYTYEIEQALLDKSSLSVEQIKKLAKRLKEGKIEPKYLITTCNYIATRDKRVWHIHGEARKPSSMILGHYYYVFLLNRMLNYIDSRKSYRWFQNKGQPNEINSWIDAFILGDVYVLGQGLDFSEIDLWWLINRKHNEIAEKGKVYFYEPYAERHKEKIALLKCLGVKVRNMGVSAVEEKDDKEKVDYETFYRRAIEEIAKQVKST